MCVPTVRATRNYSPTWLASNSIAGVAEILGKHLKNHRFWRGYCLGYCWCLRKRKYSSFKRYNNPNNNPAKMHGFPYAFLVHVGITAKIRRVSVRKQQLTLLEAIECCLGRIVSWGLLRVGFLFVPEADSDAFVRQRAYNPSHMCFPSEIHTSVTTSGQASM